MSASFSKWKLRGWYFRCIILCALFYFWNKEQKKKMLARSTSSFHLFNCSGMGKNNCLQPVRHNCGYTAACAFYGQSSSKTVCFPSLTCLSHIKLTCDMCDICPFPSQGPYFKTSTPIKLNCIQLPSHWARHTGLLTSLSLLSCMYSNKALILIIKRHPSLVQCLKNTHTRKNSQLKCQLKW